MKGENGSEWEIEDTEETEYDDGRLDEPSGMAVKLWEEGESMNTFENLSIAAQMAVDLYYKATLDFSHKKEWPGKNGIISHVCNVFSISSRTRRVIKEYPMR